MDDDPRALALMRIRHLVVEWYEGRRDPVDTLADIATLYEDPESGLDLPNDPEIAGRRIH
ncbi:MAG TPA: hypothetical protein VL358_11655 [Caulobacteraceae bacterium]|jgi:hypothetical protein|nr:hypothetical protein [Caulobacteraceae bacterium]